MKEWKEYRLGDVAKIYRGGSPRPIEDYITTNVDGVNWIKIGDVAPNSKYINTTAEKIKSIGVNHSRQVRKGDFILSNSMSFGRPYILNLDGCIHDGWLVIQDYQDTFDKEFLYYILSSADVVSQYVLMASGSSVQNLNKEKVENVIVNAPSTKEEQTRIASALSEVDALLTSLDKLIAKKQAIKEGTMQQLLTGKTRLRGFDGEWKEYELKDISDRYDNLRIPVSESNRQRGETPYYGATGIQDYVKGYTHNGEYVLLAEDGASDTRKYPIQYISGKAWVNNHAHVIQSKNDLCNNCFLYYVLKIVDFTESVSGSSRIKLNAEAMEKIKVTIPTSVDEQKCIVSILTSMDSELSALQAKRKKYEAIKQGMMQQLLTGKVRLI